MVTFIFQSVPPDGRIDNRLQRDKTEGRVAGEGICHQR